MAKLDFRKRIASICTKVSIEAIKSPVALEEEDTYLDLQGVLDDGLGKNWHRTLKMKIREVQKTVNEDIRKQRINLDSVENPARFIVNSVVIHVLESLLIKAGCFENIKELREAGLYNRLHAHVEVIDFDE
jgi:hypothetical protein